MQIQKIDMFTSPIPFKVVFRHASASRAVAENFLVRITTTNGITGYGEGCPRSYVTGETLEKCAQFVTTHQQDFQDTVQCLTSLYQWIRDHNEQINTNPSAFCALELAIFDALGKHHMSTLEELLNLPLKNFKVRYSAIIGDSHYPVYETLSKRYLSGGFTDFKLKLSGRLNEDKKKLQFWTKQVQDSSIRVRLDANNLWLNARECVAYLKQLPQIYWAVEEPLQARDFDGMSAVAQALQTQIILDESCVNDDDIRNLSGNQWLCNVRVSKHGGIYRTLELIKLIKDRKLGLLLGAHVGETSLLSRAALLVVFSLQNTQLAIEGAFGTHLLSQDLTHPEIKFINNGSIDLNNLSCLTKPGSGMEIKEDLMHEI